MSAVEQEEAERNAGKRREQQTGRAAEVNLFPILDNDDDGNGDREEDSEGRGGPQRNEERQEGDRDEGLAESEGRADEGGQKDD